MRSIIAAFRPNPLSVLGGVIVVTVLLTALFAPLLATHDPLALDLPARLNAPNAQHWFGTDEVGRDIFSRVIYGSRISLAFGIAVVSMAMSVGTVIGCFSGLSGGWVDMLIMRIVDVFLAIPPLILALATAAALGPSLFNTAIALAFVMVPGYVRLARGQSLTVRSMGYVEAAVVSGASTWQIVRRHIVPNSINPMIIAGTLDVGTVILAAAGLSFIGIGAQPPTPEWGILVGTGRQYLGNQWWCCTFPGLAIVVTAFGFNLLGDGIREYLDPRGRTR